MSKNISGVPPPPSFKTAPDVFQNIPIASFSSAPSLQELNDTEEEKKGQKTTSSRDRASSHHRKRHSRKRSRSLSPSRSRQRSKSHRSKRSRSRSPQRKQSSSLRSRSTSPISGLLETGLRFVIDKRGDTDILKYGQNSYDIPTYRRSGHGRILGMPHTKKIDTSSSKQEKDLTITDTKRSSGRSGDRAFDFWHLTQQPRTLVRPTDDDDGDLFSSQHGFIDMTPFDDSDQQASDDLATGLISSQVDYRTIQGKSKDKAERTEQTQPSSYEDYIRTKTIQYDRELAENPSDVKLWLEFIEFQDEKVKGLDSGMETKKTTSGKGALKDVKLSIFLKALEHNPEDESLWLAYLRCGAEHWDTLTLLKNWDKALERNPNSIQLWSDYINLRQTNFSSFSFDDCVKVFEDCLHTLHQTLRKLQMASNYDYNIQERENIESLMVYVVLRLCLFMKQSGYQERAFASIQALVEFCLFRPLIYQMTPSITLSQMISDFAKFWDSEVPRFGEEGAEGWKTYHNRVQNEETVIKMPPRQFSKGRESENVETIDDWLFQEQEQQRNHTLPRRMSDEELISIDDDPFRIVLSEDVTKILFNITTQAARTSLIYSIFVFLGLPYTPPGVGTNTHFHTDTFTHNDMQLDEFWPPVDKQQHRICYVDKVPMEETQQRQRHPFAVPVSYPMDIEEMFSRQDHWFGCFGKQYLVNKEEIDFTRNVCDQLLRIQKDDTHLAVCYLSFEASYGYKGGRKLAKRFLNEQQTSIKLWNAYAQMEKSYDRLDESRKVYKLAIEAAKNFPEDQRVYRPLLYRMYAQLELEHDRPQEALKIVTDMVNDMEHGESGTPATVSHSILKAKEYFLEISMTTKQRLIASENEAQTESAIETIVCQALLEYLSNGVDEASKVYKDVLDHLTQHQIQRGFISEKIWMSYMQLLYRHSKRKDSGYQPGKLREAAIQALALFPNNTVILGLFIWNESQTWIYNRVQGFFTNILETDPNIMLWLVYAHVHLHRKQPYDVNLIRTIFDEALTHQRTKSSILLWKLYIQHELRLGNVQRAQILLYRSVRECPWSKELFLFGLQEFRATMTTKDLLDWTSLMMEKDIRTRLMIDQEEFFDLDM